MNITLEDINLELEISNENMEKAVSSLNFNTEYLDMISTTLLDTETYLKSFGSINNDLLEENNKYLASMVFDSQSRQIEEATDSLQQKEEDREQKTFWKRILDNLIGIKTSLSPSSGGANKSGGNGILGGLFGKGKLRNSPIISGLIAIGTLFAFPKLLTAFTKIGSLLKGGLITKIAGGLGSFIKFFTGKKLLGLMSKFALLGGIKFVAIAAGVVFLAKFIKDIGAKLFENEAFIDAKERIMESLSNIGTKIGEWKDLFVSSIGGIWIKVKELVNFDIDWVGIKEKLKVFYDSFVSDMVEFLSGTFTGWADIFEGDFKGGISKILNSLGSAVINIFDTLAKGVLSFFGVEFDEGDDIYKAGGRLIKDVYTFAKDWVVDTFNGIIDSIKSIFSNTKQSLIDLGKNAKDVIGNFNKSILQNILPKPGGKWYDPQSIIYRAIPKEVYTYAGLDHKTGDLLATDADDVAEEARKSVALTNPVIADKIKEIVNERESVRSSSMNNPTVNAVTSNSTNLVNNNNTIFRPTPIATRSLQTPRDILYGVR